MLLPGNPNYDVVYKAWSESKGEFFSCLGTTWRTFTDGDTVKFSPTSASGFDSGYSTSSVKSVAKASTKKSHHTG